MLSNQPFPAAVVRLRSGSELRLRPLHSDDKQLLVEGFRRLSPRARYLRFLSASDGLSRSQLAYLSELDFAHHVAWAALDGEEPAGVGRFVRLASDPTAADVAITVIDDHQRRGVGTMLVESLAVAARQRGVERFHFDVLGENQGMLRLLDRLGARRRIEHNLVHAELEVASIANPVVVEGDLGALLDLASTG